MSEGEGGGGPCGSSSIGIGHTANLHKHIMDFRGFDSNIILVLRGGFSISIGDFLESLSQQILARIILVGRLGVWRASARLGRRRCTTTWARARRCTMAGSPKLRRLGEIFLFER